MAILRYLFILTECKIKKRIPRKMLVIKDITKISKEKLQSKQPLDVLSENLLIAQYVCRNVATKMTTATNNICFSVLNSLNLIGFVIWFSIISICAECWFSISHNVLRLENVAKMQHQAFTNIAKTLN